MTQAPENAQNYNRYSYAFNNPLTYTDPSGFRSADKKINCVDGCYQTSFGLEEIVVRGQRQQPASGVQGNIAALSMAGGGSGGISPGKALGDNMGHTGNPVAEVEQDDAPAPRQCGEDGLECTTVTADNLKKTLQENYQRLLKQLQMDQLFWEDMKRDTGNLGTGVAAIGILGFSFPVGVGGMIVTGVHVFSSGMSEGSDGAAKSSALPVTQFAVASFLYRVPILRNSPSTINKITNVMGYLTGMTTLDTGGD